MPIHTPSTVTRQLEPLAYMPIAAPSTVTRQRIWQNWKRAYLSLQHSYFNFEDETMLRFDEAEEETFFDTADCLSSLSPSVNTLCLSNLNSGYDIWISEPQSVEERRKFFFRVFETASSLHHDFVHGDPQRVELERVVESSEAVSISPESSVASVETTSIELERVVEFSEDVSSSPESSVADTTSMECNDREMNGEVNLRDDDSEYEQWDDQGRVEECKSFDKKKRVKSWWESFVNKTKRNRDVLKPDGETRRMKVRQNKKKCMEFSAVYIGQEFCAHKGIVRSMKFSPDGQYLASGGEDGVVRVWRVTSANTSCKRISDGFREEWKPCSGTKKSSPVSVVVPDKDFKVEELPLHEFHGHTSDVLDLAWSNSNCILSSSEDKSVRLWKVGRNKCLSVFHHNDYVTCIQFNPVDENYFISGSVDGKVRMWKVSAKRVVNWADARDLITAICYQSNGKGFVVGSLTGSCRFYEASGSDLLLTAEIHIDGRKRSCGNRISGIQFLHEDSQRVMVTSEDSKVRILDGIDVAHKYKGLSKSGSQMSASLTSNGRHIISVGEDSRVYIWNYENSCIQSSKQRSISSCEHFFSEGVTVAIPWSGMAMGSGNGNQQRCLQWSEAASTLDRYSERFSLANCYGSCGSSATWPEEKLPSWGLPVEAELDLCSNSHHGRRVGSETWGLVIVTAGLDGMIRTFHNYGLPVRI